MAKHEQNVEYVVKQVKGPGGRFEEITTMDAVLYAPDGSKFIMPFGGTVLTYVAKGYKLKPDAEWNALNEQYEKEKAESLEISNFQREISNRRLEIERAKEAKRLKAEIDSINKELEEAEAELRGELEEDEPKPKAKAKSKAKANPLKGE